MICTEIWVYHLERTCEEIAAAQKLLEYDTIVVAVEASCFEMEKHGPSKRALPIGDHAVTSMFGTKLN